MDPSQDSQLEQKGDKEAGGDQPKAQVQGGAAKHEGPPDSIVIDRQEWHLHHADVVKEHELVLFDAVTGPAIRLSKYDRVSTGDMKPLDQPPTVTVFLGVAIAHYSDAIHLQACVRHRHTIHERTFFIFASLPDFDVFSMEISKIQGVLPAAEPLTHEEIESLTRNLATFTQDLLCQIQEKHEDEKTRILLKEDERKQLVIAEKIRNVDREEKKKLEVEVEKLQHRLQETSSSQSHQKKRAKPHKETSSKKKRKREKKTQANRRQDEERGEEDEEEEEKEEEEVEGEATEETASHHHSTNNTHKQPHSHSSSSSSSSSALIPAPSTKSTHPSFSAPIPSTARLIVDAYKRASDELYTNFVVTQFKHLADNTVSDLLQAAFNM